jgi:16S rRNA (cytosine1402-N4)-methyltransferase
MAYSCRPEHLPVLLPEVIDLLAIRADGIYVDMTVGLGGHSAAILERLGPKGRLIGIDRDPAALGIAAERLKDERAILLKGRFGDAPEIISGLGIKEVDGALFDLGVSMLQLKEHDRGFSFMSDARLDMRMDMLEGPSAWDVINRYSEKELQRVLTDYGEEPLFRKIAKRIVIARQPSSIDTCAELADIVLRAYGGRGKTHPATRTFQAIRIEVNQELEQLKKGLAAAVGTLRTQGRICVIAYHSLEDRIVKNTFREMGRAGTISVLTKKPLAPARDEILRNPASRSAKLRGAEKI